jgi:hypothetical protein
MTADWHAETKQCAHCGVTFARRPWETPSTWAIHRYCSRLCRRRAERARVRSQQQQDRRDTPPDEKPDD